MASVIVMAGILAMLVALLSGSSAPNSDNPAQSRRKAVEPVAPLNPHDAAVKKSGPSAKPADPADPFAVSFGKSGLRKVTIRIVGNGLVNFSVSYRDHKGDSKRQVSGTYSRTRTIRGRYPLVSLAIQIPGGIPGSASRATCTITIDGVEVDEKTTSKAGYLMFCIA
jgi:hypothetical protein